MLPPTSITQVLSSHSTFTSARKLTGAFKNGYYFRICKKCASLKMRSLKLRKSGSACVRYRKPEQTICGVIKQSVISIVVGLSIL
jgi:hypothetical protein